MNVNEVLPKVVDWLKESYDVIFVGLIGSQNYNLHTKDSDYDFKAIVLPSLEDIIFGKKMVSKSIEHPYGGLVDVKDIRVMNEQWKKGNPNYLEILFTPWKWVDKPELYWYITHREAIAHRNVVQTKKSILGQAFDRYKNLRKETPNQAEEVKKYGFAAKQLCHLMRFLFMFEHFHELSFEELINPYFGDNDYDFDLLLDIKERRLSDEEFQMYIEGAENYLEEKKDYFKASAAAENIRLGQVMDETMYSIMKEHIKRRIENGG